MPPAPSIGPAHEGGKVKNKDSKPSSCDTVYTDFSCLRFFTLLAEKSQLDGAGDDKNINAVVNKRKVDVSFSMATG